MMRSTDACGAEPGVAPDGGGLHAFCDSLLPRAAAAGEFSRYDIRIFLLSRASPTRLTGVPRLTV